MKYIGLILSVIALGLTSCRDSRIHECEEWGSIYKKYGIKNACFMLRDHNHEAVHYYNKERCLQRFTPASTFKIFNSLVGLETAIAPDDQFVIKWDSVDRHSAAWNKDMSMREAFKVSNIGYYHELARRIGRDYMQHYLDTVQYGNRRIGTAIDSFWINDTLRISADEQVGFVKKLYFAELPFSERSQRIVKSMMLQEETPEFRLYYKTGWGMNETAQVLWVVGFFEKIEHYKEHENSMNKSNQRLYPYFFAQNFEIPLADTSGKWAKLRIEILKEVINNFNQSNK